MDARHLPDLMVFLEVVRAGSITRAAERLHMSQSNVTARIKKLEVAMASPLLKRHARGVKPTPSGEAALVMAQRLDTIVKDLRFTFGQGERGRRGKLRVGAIETVLASHLPRTVAGFQRDFPQVDVTIHTGSSTTLLKQLREGDLDAVFVSRAPELAGCREQLAFVDELVVVAPAAPEFSSSRWLQAGSSLNILVQRLGCSYTERLLGYFSAHAKRSYRLLELGTLEGILGFVELKLGVAAMPRAFVASAGARRKLQLLPLPKATRSLSTYLVVANEADCTFAVNAFYAALPSLRAQTGN